MVTDSPFHTNTLIMSLFFSMLGREVMGIWPKNADKGDINCTDLSHHGSTLAIGDDFGFVKLYKFPCFDKSVSNFLV